MRRQNAVIEVGGNSCCASVMAPLLGLHDAEELAKGFMALADPVRIRLLNLVGSAPEGEVCICNLVEPIGKSQPTISHHMKLLASAGIVHGERRGKWVWYSVDRDRLDALQAALQS